MNDKGGISLKNFIFKANILVFLLFIIGCGMLPGENIAEENTKAVIVTVDGLSFANTFVMGSAVIQNSNDYLSVLYC